MNEEKPCRHEYVRIYQRRLKGLDRRLVSTRAYLPIGFKQADFGHLSEGSYCFCTKCRARLFPKRTAADKLAARVALAQGKLNQLNELALQELVEDIGLESLEITESADTQELEDNSSKDIHVEELELESVDAQDIEAEGVKLTEDADTALAEEDM
ncbi:MAG: hypothetical protein P4L53_22010 [Candidatus Obscuribacterales bacterium]|nr:hypothetical protein [Candidatus Obscuribacterales bacterium]